MLSLEPEETHALTKYPDPVRPVLAGGPAELEQRLYKMQEVE